MSIVTECLQQAKNILFLLKKDLNEGTHIWYWHLSEKVLDIKEIGNFIETTQVANTIFIKELADLCYEIYDTYLKIYYKSDETKRPISDEIRVLLISKRRWTILKHYDLDNIIDNYFLMSPLLLSRLCISICNDLINAYPEIKKDKNTSFYKYLIDQPQQVKEKNSNDVYSSFSVLEWATIFYYVDDTKLLPQHKHVKQRMQHFMKVHGFSTSFETFKNRYYDAKSRINKENNYPIYKLEFIIPFLNKHYKQAVAKVENDIIFLKDYLP